MKNIATILAAAFLAAVLLLYMCTFQVRYTETAIRKTWGRPSGEALKDPGLHFKWPAPIQTVVKYDQRIRTLDDRAEETRTTDGRNVVVTTFTHWRITDPAKFLTNFPGGEEDGERKLRTTIVTQKLAVISRHSFDEFISTDPEKRKLRDIELEIKDAVIKDVAKEYGIDVVGFGIKKLGYPQSVSASIFNAMKAHEQAKAARFMAEGDARAADILAGAKATRDRIMSAAGEKVAAIESEAQRVVSGYYDEFKLYPELRGYLDKLRTVAEALKERTTLILDTKETPWDVFDSKTREGVVPTTTGQ